MIERVIRGSPSRIYRDMLVKAFKESQSHKKALLRLAADRRNEAE
jgi:hypothetical protein